MKNLKYIILVIITFSISACNDDFLELKPTNKVTAEDLLSSEDGIKAYLADLYERLPVEDFNLDPRNGIHNNLFNAGIFNWSLEDDAIASEYDFINFNGGNDLSYWEDGYSLNRDINLFFSNISNMTSFNENSKKLLKGEAYFLRAYNYFALARRYGGVPIISSIVDISDTEALYVPRSKEEATWDYIIATCDSAAVLLGDGDGTGRRASKWVALALKSRAALHAASVAKYWNLAPLSGEAVNLGYVGMKTDVANKYYAQCIDASEKIMNSGVFSLYKSSPANATEAANNYTEIFEKPQIAMNEVIFLRGYGVAGQPYGTFGYNFDNWCNPNQTAGAWPFTGRVNPSLDLVDTYESYTNPGKNSPIITTADGNTEDYSGYNPSKTYLTFNDPTEIFADKDARLRASVILPGATFKDTRIIIQAGFIKPDGTPVIEEPGQIEVDGQMYYTYGASTPTLFSGFDVNGNMTRSGFCIRKFLNSKYVPIVAWNMTTTDWIDFRYAEILLNYAEAVVESGKGDVAKATNALNYTRKRAAHTVDIPLNIKNVLRERRVELVYEHKRYWDLIRRREYHQVFTNTYKHALLPIYDLRIKKYIFVRKNAPRTDPHTFQTKWYYKTIPGIGSNGLVQNPQY